MFTYVLTDRDFLKTAFRLAGPIIFQHFIMFSLGLVDILMIGQLGETSVAAVGVADQMFFLVILLMFGISSGGAIFTAQYWGQKDIPRIHSVLGVSLLMALAGALAFSLAAVLAPTWVIGIYSTDPEVIRLGSSYLGIVGLSFVMTAITSSFGAVLRSIENVKLPMLVSLMSLSLNTVLNYGLIFGHFGLPELGVAGAAIATATARSLEAMVLVLIVYRRQLPVAATPRQLLNFKLISLRRFFIVTLPVVGTEIAWSFGITTYNVVYARIGTDAIAAVNIAGALERVVFVIFIGLGNACAIMIGHKIGANQTHKVDDYTRRFLILTPALAVVVGVILLILGNLVLPVYNIAASTAAYVQAILWIMFLTLPLRSTNLMVLVGMLRSGGDTRFAFWIDACSMWLVGVPLAFFSAFWLGLPVYLVYLVIMTEEALKFLLGLWRIRSRKWVNNLAAAPA
jgi:putative MATE family efflux protein